MAEPYCLAMVLCDAVHRDPSTGKFTLLGTFSNFAAREYPLSVVLSIYFAVTDGLGPVTFSIQLVDAAAGAIDASHDDLVDGRIAHIKDKHDFQSPLQVLESVVIFPQLIIPKPGLYHCELWANGDVLMSRRFTAKHVPLEA